MKKFLLSIFCCLMAVFAVQAQSYVKVTSAPADWSGEYLIVYEAGNVAFNGGLTTLDVASNTISVEIVEDEIASTVATDGAKFTINSDGSIQSASGYYIGRNATSNGLNSSTSTKYTNTISLNSDGSAPIVGSGGAVLRYNATSGQYRFRYYKSSSYASQKAIALYKYTEGGGGETPEPETPVLPGAPTLPVSTTFKGSMSVEITGIAEDATIYYTTDGTVPSTTNGTVYTAPFEITTTTTVMAVAVNEAGASEPATATYTLFVVEETAGYYMKVVAESTDWSGKYLIVYEDGADAYVFNGVDDVNGYVSAVTDGDVIKANSEIDAVAVTIATMEGGYSISTVSGYMYKTAYSNGIDFGETSKAVNTFAIAEDGVVITSGNNDDKTTFRFNKATDQKRFRYYKSGQQPVQLYKYVEELPMNHTLTVTDAGWATLFLGFNARIPSAVEAYTVTAVNNGWVTLTQVTGVLPSNQGVIINAPAGDYKLYYETTATADVTGNLLEGSAYNRNIDEEAYVLGKVDGEVGLYKAKMTDGTWLNNANKAYLPASSVPNKTVEFYGFDWGGTTGIENIEGVAGNNFGEGAIYDLTGRKINSIAVTGIYIIDGKKVFIRK